jgi:hypothetical protein
MKKALFKGIEEELLNDLSNAKNEIKIAVAWFTNHKLYDIICKKIEQGLKVTTVVIYDPINVREGGLDWQNYIDIGGVLYMSKYPDIMHHKFCLIDNKTLYNGSYNWTYYAERYNIENTIKFTNEHNLNKEFDSEFDMIIKKLKRYKKVRTFSFEELIDWFSNKPNSYYISKDIEFGIKSSRIAYPEIALKSIDAATQLRNNEKINSLLSLRDKIEKKEKKKHERELTKKILTPQISRITEKLDRFQAKPKEKNKARKSTTSVKIGNSRISSKKDAKEYVQILDSIEKKGFEGELGELRINLQWGTKDDLDLHVIDPCKNRIYYSEMEHECKNSIGLLDFDTNAGSPLTKKAQENIFWKEKPPTGIYTIFVNHYKFNQEKEVPFVVSIISKKGKSKVIIGKVHKSNMETVKVASFEYRRKKGITKIKEILEKSSI